MLNGRTIIELTDVKTGVTEKIEKTNMVTNAINSFYRDNCFGFKDLNSTFIYNSERKFMPFSKSFEIPSSDYFKFVYAPIMGRLIGGVLCYSSPLEENSDNFYASLTNELVACANIEKNQHDELTRRGSFNSVESGPTDKGYRFVWDFSTHQGNGTISSLGLTSFWGGINGFDGVPFVKFNNSGFEDYSNLENYLKNDEFRAYVYRMQNLIEFDPVKNTGISIGIVKKADKKVITIWKIKLSITKRRLFSHYFAGNDVLEIHELPTTNENFTHLPKSGNFMFADGKDGYWYGLMSIGGEISYWIKINKKDYSFTTGEWDGFGFELTGKKILDNDDNYYWRITIRSSMIIKDDYIYLKNHNDQIFIINKNTGVVESKEYSGCRAFWIDMLGAVWNYGDNEKQLNLRSSNYIDSYYEAPTFYIGTDRYDKIHYHFLSNLKSIPHNFLFKITNSVLIHGFSGVYPIQALVTPYLATINNLQEPVTKTADKTMKITYILEEEDE